jgi:hypothetical protein
VRLFSFDAGLCQFLLTSRYSISYFQVQYFLLPGTVFLTSRYSISYFQVQYFLLPGTVFLQLFPYPLNSRYLGYICQCKGKSSLDCKAKTSPLPEVIPLQLYMNISLCSDRGIDIFLSIV